MLRRTGLKRGKRLHAKAPLRRRTPLRAKHALKPSRGERSIPNDLRKALAQRSEGMCEVMIPGRCTWLAAHASHRQGRKTGGRHGEAITANDRLSNLVHACAACHEWIGDNRAEAETFGLIVRDRFDPALEPVLRRGAAVYLCDVGGVYPYEEVGT